MKLKMRSQGFLTSVEKLYPSYLYHEHGSTQHMACIVAPEPDPINLFLFMKVQHLK